MKKYKYVLIIGYNSIYKLSGFEMLREFYQKHQGIIITPNINNELQPSDLDMLEGKIDANTRIDLSFL